MGSPEAQARLAIDRKLEQAGWVVQSMSEVNLYAKRGVAVREFQFATGPADYLLFVDQKPVGVLEAKQEGTTLTGVELQTEQYSRGLPHLIRSKAPILPLPFLYESTGVETRFTSRLDPEPRSREVFHFHRPETLAEWLASDPIWLSKDHRLVDKPASLRLRLTALPPLEKPGLWPAQHQAVTNLERSLSGGKPRALIQMATGSGKTFAAVSSSYRLIKHGGARRILFLVDRANLGRQALKEFQAYRTPDDGRLFTELYNVQRLTSGRIDSVAKVCISTIQRLYSMLQGRELVDEDDERSVAGLEALRRDPFPVDYNPAIPIETFDVIFIDECHRSIYTLWKQVIDYFDAFLIGLTATPSKQTLGFFNQNLVMEYRHDQAVADGVNVDFDIYRIRTRITEQGSKVEAGLYVDRRDRETRRKRWERLDQDLVYGGPELDRDVVAADQIRTVIQAFRDKLPEMFPGRTDVPKTLIYAKSDSHADDIVQIVREEFGKGNEFAQKITYKTTGVDTDDLIAAFRNSYHPRIAVTVDMIATGTDIKPLEVVMFLRAPKSRNLFEQMKGRGVRVIDDSDFQAVTPDARSKTRFVIVDCVGVCEHDLADTRPLERKPTVSLEKLLQAISVGNTDPEVVSTLAGRLARLDHELSADERRFLTEKAAGEPLRNIVSGLLASIDPDRMEAAGERAAEGIEQALRPLAANPGLRQLLVDIRKAHDQIIDAVSQDEVLEAGFSEAARERARTLVTSFEQFIQDHKDEITALQVLYNRPPGKRLRYEDIRALADVIQAPPRQWTPERLWQAYETLFTSRVRGAPAKVLTNLVSLVRFAMTHEELVPFPDLVDGRYRAWLSGQENAGRKFTPEQRQWLGLIRDQIAANLEVRPEDFDYSPFAQRGGLGGAHRAFGTDLSALLVELSDTLAA